jgi:multiple sugar transport system substrate-binding protein
MSLPSVAISKNFPVMSQAPPLIVKRMRRLRPWGEQGAAKRLAGTSWRSLSNACSVHGRVGAARGVNKEEELVDVSRRQILQSGAAAGLLMLPGGAAGADSTWSGPAPEPGASIRVLRWKQFIQAEFDSFVANTKKFADQTGVKVRVDAESWDDIRPKSAVAANVGAGPDIIFGTLDDPFKFREKLLDLTDLAEYLGDKYGGWYPVARKYGTFNKRWIALPQGASGGCMNYRISAMHAAGFDEFPKDTAGYLKLCQGLKKTGKPPGFALGHATGDANGWTQWCMWAFGGKTVDDNNNVVIDSPETVAALEYATQLYGTYIDGVLSWLDPSNNKAFLADQISLTLNGISIYTVAKNSPDPALQAIAADMDHANMPIGPIGRPTEQQNILNTYAYAYTKYPNAVREYLRFMWEKPQVDYWETQSNGYVAPPLPAWNDNPVWTADPKATRFRDVLKYALDDGYSGALGSASAAVMGNFVVVDMFAEACTGNKSPKDAAHDAAERVKRYYSA